MGHIPTPHRGNTEHKEYKLYQIGNVYSSSEYNSLQNASLAILYSSWISMLDVELLLMLILL
jgi:hypothetical protein